VIWLRKSLRDWSITITPITTFRKLFPQSIHMKTLSMIYSFVAVKKMNRMHNPKILLKLPRATEIKNSQSRKKSRAGHYRGTPSRFFWTSFINGSIGSIYLTTETLNLLWKMPLHSPKTSHWCLSFYFERLIHFHLFFLNDG
jgi:hypothetical protein